MLRNIRPALQQFIRSRDYLARYRQRQAVKTVAANWLVEHYGARDWINKTEFRFRDNAGELIVPQAIVANQIRLNLYDLRRTLYEQCPQLRTMKELRVRVARKWR